MGNKGFICKECITAMQKIISKEMNISKGAGTEASKGTVEGASKNNSIFKAAKNACGAKGAGAGNDGKIRVEEASKDKSIFKTAKKEDVGKAPSVRVTRRKKN